MHKKLGLYLHIVKGFSLYSLGPRRSPWQQPDRPTLVVLFIPEIELQALPSSLVQREVHRDRFADDLGESTVSPLGTHPFEFFDGGGGEEVVAEAPAEAEG